MQNMCILTVSLPLDVPLPWVNIQEDYSVKIVFLFPSSKLSALLHIPKDLIIIIICFQLNAFCIFTMFLFASSGSEFALFFLLTYMSSSQHF